MGAYSAVAGLGLPVDARNKGWLDAKKKLVEESEADRLRLIGQKKDKELSYVAEIVPPFSTGQELPNPVLAIEKEIHSEFFLFFLIAIAVSLIPGVLSRLVGLGLKEDKYHKRRRHICYFGLKKGKSLIPSPWVPTYVRILF
ncbi:hypothetical protein VNO77_50422 [Canavalia gladiata]|uniref:Uncharacterized protein n=1 Tax=Canavalia gladiata TaxID=3824 RepID=A0AAN9JDB5_CANGL